MQTNMFVGNYSTEASASRHGDMGLRAYRSWSASAFLRSAWASPSESASGRFMFYSVYSYRWTIRPLSHSGARFGTWNFSWSHRNRIGQ
jgi:hypothetical protein